MTSRFQSIEQTLSWFSPCLLFCAAPVLVTIVVYTVVRIVRKRQDGPARTMYDPAATPKTERVDRSSIAFTRQAPESRSAERDPRP